MFAKVTYNIMAKPVRTGLEDPLSITHYLGPPSFLSAATTDSIESSQTGQKALKIIVTWHYISDVRFMKSGHFVLQITP